MARRSWCISCLPLSPSANFSSFATPVATRTTRMRSDFSRLRGREPGASRDSVRCGLRYARSRWGCRSAGLGEVLKPGDRVRFRAHGDTGLVMTVVTRDGDDIGLCFPNGRLLTGVPIELLVLMPAAPAVEVPIREVDGFQ